MSNDGVACNKKVAILEAVAKWRRLAKKQREKAQLCCSYESKKALDDLANCYEKLANKIEKTLCIEDTN